MENKRCPCCGYYPNRACTIDALIIKEKKILLIKRAEEPMRGFWALPGGHLDWDENLEETVKREVYEETYLHVEKIHLLNMYSAPKRHPKQAVAVAYLVEAFGEPKLAKDTLDIAYFPLKKLPEQLAFDHRQIINDAIRRIVKEYG